MFHQNLKLLRKKYGYNQTEFGKIFKVTQTSVQRWEDETEPKYPVLLEICKLFKVSVDAMLGQDLSKDQPPEIPLEGESHLKQIIGEMTLEARQRDKYIEIKESEIEETVQVLFEVTKLLNKIDYDEETAKKLAEFNKTLEAYYKDK